MSRFRAFLIASASAWPALASAQQTQTDAAQQIAGMLTKYGPVKWDDSHQVEDDQVICVPTAAAFGNGPSQRCHVEKGTKTVGGQHNDILTASNIRVATMSPVYFDKPTLFEIPDHFVADSFTQNNCDAAKTPTQTIAVSATLQRSTSITVTHSITNTIGATAEGAYEPAGVGAKVSVNVSNATTNATARLSGDQTSVMRSGQISIQVDPQSSETVGIESWPVVYNAPFHIDAIVEADLSNGKELSDLFSQQERTLPITGTIGLTDAAQAVGYNLKGPLDASLCGNGPVKDTPPKGLPVEGMKVARAVANKGAVK